MSRLLKTIVMKNPRTAVLHKAGPKKPTV